ALLSRADGPRMPTSIKPAHRDRRPLLAGLLTVFTLTAGCGADDPDVPAIEFRDHEGECTIEDGAFEDCAGPNCPVWQDFVIRCPGHFSAEALQLAMNSLRIWGSFSVSGYKGRSIHPFRVTVGNLEF